MTDGGILSICKGRLAEMEGYQLRKGAGRGGGRGADGRELYRHSNAKGIDRAYTKLVPSKRLKESTD